MVRRTRPGISRFRIRRCAALRNDGTALNLAGPCRDQTQGFVDFGGRNTSMKIALLVVLGLVLGALGGAALGIGAGLAWVEFFKTTSFEGYSGMLVFFIF